MGLRGKEIHRGYDQFGTVRVLDDGSKRYLTFGDDDEQSCWLKAEPLVPQHDYVRAMLLVLLFKQPKTALALGLGAGGLNSCLHHHVSDLSQTVIELRSEVISVAHRYFSLPRAQRLTVLNMDAFEYLNGLDRSPVDLLFSDIYREDGIDQQQLSPAFLHLCYEQLTADGWLVLNCWQEHRSGDTLELLKANFADVRGCVTQSGNWLLFAGKQRDEQTVQQLKERARLLAPMLGFSLVSALARLQQY